MARVHPAQLAFNAGEFGEEMSSRIDFQRYALAAASMRNWLPLAQGGMTRRQGFQWCGTPDEDSHLIPFGSDLAQGFLVLAEPGQFRFWQGLDPVTSPSAVVTISNGTFVAGLAGWTDDSTGSATVVGDGTKLTLTVPISSSDAARLTQQITGLTAGVEYWVEITVASGPVDFLFGSAAGATNFGRYSLDEGQHMVSVTPTGTSFYLRIESRDSSPREVTSVLAASSSAALVLDSPYDATDLAAIRYDQTIDVMFMGVETYQLSSLSRLGTTSFGFGKELLRNGPYQAFGDPLITITPSAVDGDITLTASDVLFEAGSVGQQIELTHPGQTESASISAQNTFTDPILISGSGTFREMTVVITGTWSATVTVQRSFGTPGSWVDWKNYTTNQNVVLDDTLDGSDIYYRIGIKTGNYSSGTAVVEISNDSGETTGAAEITEFTSETVVTARVLDQIANIDATSIWRLSEFGGSRGYPQNPVVHEGRLWISRSAQSWSSVSDDYTNFESGTNDDQSISRIVDSRIRWIKDSGELCIGTDTSEQFGQTSNNQPYTPLDFRFRRTASDGVANVDAVATDTAVLYVARDAETIGEYSFDPGAGGYFSTSMTRLHPRIGFGGIVKLAMQFAPEKRLWVVKETGEVVILTYLREEDVIGWSRLDIDGLVSDVAIVRADRQDQVYLQTDLDGTQCLLKYSDEVWDIPSASNHLDYGITAVEPTTRNARLTPSGVSGTITVTASSSVFVAGDVNKRIFMGVGYGTITAQAGTSATVTLTVPIKNTISIPAGYWYVGATTTAVTGLPAVLEGESVYARVDNKDQGPFTVSGNAITLTTAGAWVHVGFRKTAVFQSLKLHQGAQAGAGIVGQTKRVNMLGVALKDTADGLRLGAIDDATTDAIKTIEYLVTYPGAVFTGEAEQTVDGLHGFDPRCYIVAGGGGPATVLSYSPTVKINESK